jgi:TrpR-related protein YerC/YecD
MEERAILGSASPASKGKRGIAGRANVLTCYYTIMKTNRQFSPRHEAQTERNLVAAMLTLRTPEELRAFLKDLCTPAELQAMADRWAVVEYLQQQLPYREIHRITGVSVTTIGRVARYLATGAGGYALAVKRLENL